MSVKRKERLTLSLLGLCVVLALFQTSRLSQSIRSLQATTELHEVHLRLRHLLELSTLSPEQDIKAELNALLNRYSHLAESDIPERLIVAQTGGVTSLAEATQFVDQELESFRGVRLPQAWTEAREDIWLTTLFWILAILTALSRTRRKALAPAPSTPGPERSVPLSVTHMAMKARESDPGLPQTSVRSYTERVLKALSNLLILAGPDGEIQMVNDAVCSVLEYERGALLGLPHTTLLDSELTDLSPGTQNMETGFKKGSGESVPVLVSCSAVYGESNDRLEGLVIVAQDISERKETEKSLRSSEKRLRDLMERLKNAQEEERQRVARDLHDGMLQLVIAAEMQLTVCRKKIDPEGKQSGLRQGIECLSEAVKEGRRLIQNLRPPSLDKFGLVQSVRQEGLKLSRDLECETEFSFELEDREIPSSLENAVFRICQEALNNIRKHASPKKVSISFRVTRGSLVVTVKDDGQGFDLKNESFGSGVGLHSMRERAELQGGYLKHESTLGQGTCVTAVIPLKDKETV